MGGVPDHGEADRVLPLAARAVEQELVVEVASVGRDMYTHACLPKCTTTTVSDHTNAS